MGFINHVVVEGNLTQSAELSRWTDGTPYIRFTIAYNDSYKNKDTGEWESIPSFFDCQCKGNYAEAMSKHLLKGRRISVEGKLKQQSWTDDQGIKHSRVIIRVENISLAPFGNNSFRPTEATQQAAEYNYQNTEPEHYDASMFDDQLPEDIPF